MNEQFTTVFSYYKIFSMKVSFKLKDYFKIILLLLLLQVCGQGIDKPQNEGNKSSSDSFKIQRQENIPSINTEGNTILTRFSPPTGYTRTTVEENTFGDYLRNLPLKDATANVLYFNGHTKINHGVYEAVVDLPIGNKDLHQCADAVMRLRAEFLYTEKRYEAIHFNFTNGFRVDYSEWMKGKRVVVKGNKTWWEQKTQASNSYESFWKYMETIFMYAGTLSLSKELKTVEISDIKIGDVFIQGGSPGHAVIVVDMAVDTMNSRKVFMVAQSYMPAQEIQVLTNPENAIISPWYSLDFRTRLLTPEWIFTSDNLKRFSE